MSVFTDVDVNKEVDNFIKAHEAGKFSVAPGATFDICAFYKGTPRTILYAVKGIVAFFNAKYGQAIDIIVQNLDAACNIK